MKIPEVDIEFLSDSDQVKSLKAEVDPRFWEKIDALLTDRGDEHWFFGPNKSKILGAVNVLSRNQGASFDQEEHCRRYVARKGYR